MLGQFLLYCLRHDRGVGIGSLVVRPAHSDIGVTFVTDSGAVCCNVAKRVNKRGVRIQRERMTDAGGIKRR